MTHTSISDPVLTSMIDSASSRTAPRTSWPEWRCTDCGKLLGVAKGNQLHIRLQKNREYMVGYPVTANCHGCGTLNSKTAR
jgi:hypothetical protein